MIRATSLTSSIAVAISCETTCIPKHTIEVIDHAISNQVLCLRYGPNSSLVHRRIRLRIACTWNSTTTDVASSPRTNCNIEKKLIVQLISIFDIEWCTANIVYDVIFNDSIVGTCTRIVRGCDCARVCFSLIFLRTMNNNSTLMTVLERVTTNQTCRAVLHEV